MHEEAQTSPDDSQSTTANPLTIPLISSERVQKKKKQTTKPKTCMRRGIMPLLYQDKIPQPAVFYLTI